LWHHNYCPESKRLKTAGRKLAALNQFVLLIVFNPFVSGGGTRGEKRKSFQPANARAIQKNQLSPQIQISD